MVMMMRRMPRGAQPRECFGAGSAGGAARRRQRRGLPEVGAGPRLGAKGVRGCERWLPQPSRGTCSPVHLLLPRPFPVPLLGAAPGGGVWVRPAGC